MKRILIAVTLLVVISTWANAQAQAPIKTLEGMWSNPPSTILGRFCTFWCSDSGIQKLNALVDDPANDAKPFPELQNAAANYQRDSYVRPLLTDAALKTFPLDPADDPSFLHCEPYGFVKQFLAPHQLEIRQMGKDRIDLHYGEWDAHRTIYMDGRKIPTGQKPTLLGYSVGHWEGETLVIETAGIRSNVTGWLSQHSDQLHAVERYTRSNDRKTLMMTATLEDPWSLRQPMVVKKLWAWAPDQKIAAYDQCEIPKEFKRGTGR